MPYVTLVDGRAVEITQDQYDRYYRKPQRETNMHRKVKGVNGELFIEAHVTCIWPGHIEESKYGVPPVYNYDPFDARELPECGVDVEKEIEASEIFSKKGKENGVNKETKSSVPGSLDDLFGSEDGNIMDVPPAPEIKQKKRGRPKKNDKK